MSDRTTQQLELDLDVFWNDLVAGRKPIGATNAEKELVAHLNSGDLPAAPRAGFFDALWMQLLEPEGAEWTEVTASPPSAPVVAPVVPWPMRPQEPLRSAHRHWSSFANAIAALLLVAAAGAFLIVVQRNGAHAPGAERWSMTGGDPANTNSNSAAPAIVDPQVQWQVETDGRIDGAPVVSDGVVFIGNHEHHLYALDAATGVERWDANLRKPIIGSAAVGSGLVVVGTSTSLFGLDVATGAIVWQQDDVIAASDPAIVDGAIYLVDDGNRLRSFDLKTGADRWTSDPFATTPAYAIDARSGRVFATTPGGMMSAWSIDNGEQIWEVDPGLGALGRPLVDGDLIALSIPGGVALVDGATGEVKNKTVAGVETFSSVLALVDDLLIGTSDLMVDAYHHDSLQVEWMNPQLSGLTGDISAGAGSIYLPGKERTLTAIDSETGEVQWVLPLDEVAQAAPAVTDERVLIATRAGSVYAIGEEGASVLNAPSIEEEAAAALADPLWKSTGGPNALKNPTGIAVSPSGEVWVCDTANDRLQIFDSDGHFLREFGSHGSEPGQFDFGEETAQMDGFAPLGHACSLAFDASGALYVADAANFRVQRFPASAFNWMANACCTIRSGGTNYSFPDSAAEPDLIFGSEGAEAGQFLFPSDVAVAPNGDIFVGDRQRLDVQRFDSDGHYKETIGEPATGGLVTPGSFSRIVGIAVDQNGRLHVVDDDRQQIVRLELDGTWTVIQLPRRDFRINGIAVDALGNFFVSQIDPSAGSFWLYDATGKPLAQVGSYGTGLGQFDSSTGITLDGSGNVYVTDWGLNRLQKFAIDYQQLEAMSEESGR